MNCSVPVLMTLAKIFSSDSTNSGQVEASSKVFSAYLDGAGALNGEAPNGSMPKAKARLRFLSARRQLSSQGRTRTDGSRGMSTPLFFPHVPCCLRRPQLHCSWIVAEQTTVGQGCPGWQISRHLCEQFLSSRPHGFGQPMVSETLESSSQGALWQVRVQACAPHFSGSPQIRPQLVVPCWWHGVCRCMCPHMHQAATNSMQGGQLVVPR